MAYQHKIFIDYLLLAVINKIILYDAESSL